MLQAGFFRWCVALTLALALKVNVVADYLWPLPYGKELSSIFGDWRTRHYHAGIDIRTGGRSGRAVVAPDDGQISRVRASSFGYGKALHLQMRDGNTAVFAHLARFHPRIEEYLRKKQIADESYGQDLYPQKDQFRFSKGDTIAWSGQTGVGAPHLHVEIRTPDNKTVNPLAFSGLRVKDTEPPLFRRLKLIGRHNEELLRALGYRLEYQFVKDQKQDIYRLRDTVFCDWRVPWLAVEVVDKVGTNDWWKPIYSIQLRHQDSLLYELTYDTISFDQSYLIDHERNFHEARKGSSEFYNLVSLKQAIDRFSICQALGGRPLFLEIVARDIAGNESRASVAFDCHPKRITPDYPKLRALLTRSGKKEKEAFVVQIPSSEGLDILLYDSVWRGEEIGTWSFLLGNRPIQELAVLGNGFYLGSTQSWQWDVNAGYEYGISLHSPHLPHGQAYSKIGLDYRPPIGLMETDTAFLYAGQSPFKVILSPIEAAFLPIERYFCFKIDVDTTDKGITFSIEPNDLPLAKPVTFRYEFDPAMPPEGVGFYYLDNGKPSFIGSEIDTVDQSLSAQNYRLGTIAMLIDTIPPNLANVTPQDQSSVFTSRPTMKAHISDDLSGIRDKIELRIDGQWCIPEFDPESGMIESTPHFDLKPGRHRLEITVSDQIGNRGRYTSSFSFVVRRK